ncbi:MAG TPA: FMN-binding glutamate synthase family protein [Candidatus Nanoarchaeia archaeon]|nr:FMN-binding glutamate synthase family protein [Candidatus Nanoarchaeia archaeon]
MSKVYVDIGKLASTFSGTLWAGTALSAAAACINPDVLKSPSFVALGAGFAGLTAADSYLRHFQTQHALLRNFGLFGTLRYFFESFGPEFRQYFVANDQEEKPFSRNERRAIYRRAHNDTEQTMPFGTQVDLEGRVMFVPSLYPKDPSTIRPYCATFGEERGISTAYSINHPMMISAMSFGALGKQAVQALSHGAREAGIPLNTGEGGLSKYHLSGGCDIIYEMGTAKFGCRNNDSSMNDEKLRALCRHPEVKMVEIKFSQGAKPGSGGVLPKEKLTPEIAEAREVPLGHDVVSPVRHVECDTPEHTAQFVRRVQDVSGLPVGIKMALAQPAEFRRLVQVMRDTSSLPDYFVIDGAEGGTGAAPQSFLDSLGIPLFPSLDIVVNILEEEQVRNHVKLVASGKLATPEQILKGFCYGADAVYVGRGFLFSLGCIQALQCNTNNCPTGITTHDPKLERGLNVKDKKSKVASYVKNTEKEMYRLLGAAGHDDLRAADKSILHVDGKPLT